MKNFIINSWEMCFILWFIIFNIVPWRLLSRKEKKFRHKKPHITMGFFIMWVIITYPFYYVSLMLILTPRQFLR
jgi:hypothetical protein